ncbi:MAG: hypothetical protein ACQEXV_22490 [Bacillota bacterium]
MQQTFDFFGDMLDISAPPENIDNPIHMTLTQFLNCPEWLPVMDEKAMNEHKGMYKMKKPDGKWWDGGWIGKFRTSEAAKRNFHDQSVYYAIFGGREIISDTVLNDYPQYKMAQDAILDMESRIEFTDGPVVRVNTIHGSRFFHTYDFPLYCRVETRGFVRDHQLDEGIPRYIDKGDTLFTPNETACIGLSRKMGCIMSKSYRPHFSIREYDSFRYKTGLKIRFRLREWMDCEGVGYVRPNFTEGITVYNVGGLHPLVQYTDDQGDTHRQTVYPSELLGFYNDSGSFVACELDEKIVDITKGVFSSPRFTSL